MEKEIKIITLGDSGVGKISIINRIIDNSFDEYVPCTIAVNFKVLIRDYTKKK